MPRRAENGGDEQDDAEVNDRRSAERRDLAAAALQPLFRDQRHHHELEPGQGPG